MKPLLLGPSVVIPAYDDSAKLPPSGAQFKRVSGTPVDQRRVWRNRGYDAVSLWRVPSTREKMRAW